MTSDVWVTVAVTDRATALRSLLSDLVENFADVGVPLSVFVVENSVSASERRTTRATAAELCRPDVRIEIEDQAPYGRNIAMSRRRQRDWVAVALENNAAPSFIWMLDDDARLDHLVWDGSLQVQRLEHHVSRLLELAGRADRPDLLVGQVTGDPPIPAAATLASRLADLAANVTLLLGAHPHDRAASVLSSLRVAGAHDDYYDFSLERSTPSWASPCRWLQRDPDSTVGEVTHRLLSEAQYLGSGIALTRPILADADRLRDLTPTYRRGGNAVFFTPQACLEHTYPSLSLDGLQTRRGDMVGALLLGRRWRVMGAGFSVRHCRARTKRTPRRDELERSVVSDNLGAALARGVAVDDPVPVVRNFLRDRAEAVRLAMVAARAASQDMLGALRTLPGWVATDVAAEVEATCRRIDDALPLTGASLSSWVTEGLSSRLHIERLGAEAIRVRRASCRGRTDRGVNRH